MAYQGKTQLTAIMIAPPDIVEEGERLFRKHAAWMESTHHRSGPMGLLSYTVSTGPEMTNPMDPNAEPTGNTCFTLTEIYESPAGVSNHFEQAGSWTDFPEIVAWLEKCQVTMVPVASVGHSLW